MDSNRRFQDYVNFWAARDVCAVQGCLLLLLVIVLLPVPLLLLVALGAGLEWLTKLFGG